MCNFFFFGTNYSARPFRPSRQNHAPAAPPQNANRWTLFSSENREIVTVVTRYWPLPIWFWTFKFETPRSPRHIYSTFRKKVILNDHFYRKHSCSREKIIVKKQRIRRCALKKKLKSIYVYLYIVFYNKKRGVTQRYYCWSFAERTRQPPAAGAMNYIITIVIIIITTVIDGYFAYKLASAAVSCVSQTAGGGQDARNNRAVYHLS